MKPWAINVNQPKTTAHVWNRGLYT